MTRTGRLRRGASSAAPRLDRRTVRVGSWALHARVSTGRPPPGRPAVVLVHGLGMSSRSMIPLMEALAPDFVVHAPDLPGFGRSERPACILSVAELAEVVAGYMDAEAIPRAALIGNSFGCEIAVETGLRHPHRVERMVLQGPTPDPQDRSALGQIAGLLATAPFERPSLVWVAVSDYLRAGPARILGTSREMIAHRVERKLGRLSAPALVVVGARDRVVPRHAAESVARLLPKGRLAVVAGAAHGMNYSHPEALRAAILPFLLRTARR